MFLGGARELCPDIVCIPYDFEGYSEVSHKLYDLVARFVTPSPPLTHVKHTPGNLKYFYKSWSPLELDKIYGMLNWA